MASAGPFRQRAAGAAGGGGTRHPPFREACDWVDWSAGGSPTDGAPPLVFLCVCGRGTRGSARFRGGRREGCRCLWCLRFTFAVPPAPMPPHIGSADVEPRARFDEPGLRRWAPRCHRLDRWRMRGRTDFRGRAPFSTLASTAALGFVSSSRSACVAERFSGRVRRPIGQEAPGSTRFGEHRHA